MTTICFALTRAIHFGACLLLLCVCFFDRFIAGSLGIWPRIARRLILIALPLALLTGILWFGLNTIDMSGLPVRQALRMDTLRIVWSQTLFGSLWELRLFFWLAAAGAAVPILFRRRPTWLLAALGAALLATLAWAGHGQTGPLRSWHLAADITHLLVAALWPTGLLPLTLLLWKFRSSPTDETEQSIISLTRRFSTMSLISVALLAVTGIANTLFLLGSIAKIFSTTYGRVLSIKLALFGMMVALGAVNLIYLKPRLSSNSEHKTTAARLRLSVATELALATIILIVVGILGRLPPE